MQKSGMKYKLIIFDFDGTLADTFFWFKNVVNKIADKYKFKRIDESEADILRNYSAGKFIKHLGVPLWKIGEIAYDMKKMMQHDIRQISLFEGIDNLLKILSNKGALLAVVSSNSLENVRKVLGPENAALINHFECGVSLFGKHAKLKKVIRKIKVQCSESIYIGDEIRDREAARNVNIAFGGVSWGYNSVESLIAHSPVEIFHNIDDILEKIA